MIIGHLDNKEGAQGGTQTNRRLSGSRRGRQAYRISDKIFLSSGRLSLCDNAPENPLWLAGINYTSRPENTGSGEKFSQRMDNFDGRLLGHQQIKRMRNAVLWVSGRYPVFTDRIFILRVAQ